MPIYAYQAKEPEASCEKCKGGFDLRQSLSDPALEACPWCGAPVARVPSLPAIGFSQSGLDDRARAAGFTKLSRIGKGEYERNF